MESKRSRRSRRPKRGNSRETEGNGSTRPAASCFLEVVKFLLLLAIAGGSLHSQCLFPSNETTVLKGHAPGNAAFAINVTENPTLQPHIYFCQNGGNGIEESLAVLSSVFPEYQLVNWENLDGRSWWSIKKDRGNPYDLFLFSVDGYCKHAFIHKWLMDYYRGKIVYTSGEDSEIPNLRDELTYVLGPIPVAERYQSMRLYYLQMVFWFYLHHQKNIDVGDNDHLVSEQNIYNPQLKPKSTGQHFLLYINTNCVGFRQDAYDELSKIGMVHHGGKCAGNLPSSNKTAIQINVHRYKWFGNLPTYRDYRFCLVMEHGKVDGYVTEKILLSYLAGCIPIYFGPSEIFDLFNAESFIYYDIENPQPAIERIRSMEGNRTLYEWVMSQPILAHGEQTVQDYFSFSDDVGGGVLKQRIRRILDLDQYQFH